MNATQLHHTTQVLTQMLTFKQPADVVLSRYLREHKKLGKNDRHEIAETAFATLRHYEKIASVLPQPHTESRKAALAAENLRLLAFG
jgi:16S rRNA (cytosine967-C5)-methyltransferase